MIKPAEIREVKECDKFETTMMAYTAVMVPITDFLTGVLSALVLYAVARKVFPNASAPKEEPAADIYEPAH